QDVRVLGAIPDVAAEEQLRGKLRGERDPAAQRAHRALDGVAVVPDQSRRLVGRGPAGERVRLLLGPGGGRGHQYTGERWVVLIRRSIASPVKPPSSRASRAMEMGTAS